MSSVVVLVLAFILLSAVNVSGFGIRIGSRVHPRSKQVLSTSQSTIFSSDQTDEISLKYQILHLGATLDRGQLYNPTSGEQYSGNMKVARSKIEQLVSTQNRTYTLEEMDGEWELVLSTVPHGIFRSSPFFLAIQEAYRQAGEPDKALLFFKLHELQTCSFGISKIGRVAQVINAEKKELISEFDTSIFSLTALPIIGFWKLLPTFGGCVVTVSKCNMNENGIDLNLEVEYTTAKKVDGLNGLFDGTFNLKAPVNPIWKLLPWNKGRAPICSIQTVYLDKDFRIMKDNDGELFVYTRPVVSRL